MCGLPPFVDEMIDVFVDDGMVFVGVPRLFTRPLRLTAPEGFAVVVGAGRDGAARCRSDRTARAGLEKLARALIDAGLEVRRPTTRRASSSTWRGHR